MATTTTHASDTLDDDRPRIGAGLVKLMTFFSTIFHTISNASQCHQEVQRLLELSNDELASHRLRREDIPQYAFRRYMEAR